MWQPLYASKPLRSTALGVPFFAELHEEHQETNSRKASLAGVIGL